MATYCRSDGSKHKFLYSQVRYIHPNLSFTSVLSDENSGDTHSKVVTFGGAFSIRCTGMLLNVAEYLIVFAGGISLRCGWFIFRLTSTYF